MQNLKELLNKEFKKMTKSNAEAIYSRYCDSTVSSLNDVYCNYSSRKANGWDYCINKSNKLFNELKQNYKDVVDWALYITGFNTCTFSCAKIIRINVNDLKVTILLYYTHCNDYYYIFKD